MKYRSISIWIEKSEVFWDVITFTPVTKNKALEFAHKATKTWNNTENKIRHSEIIIKETTYKDLLNNSSKIIYNENRDEFEIKKRIN